MKILLINPSRTYYRGSKGIRLGLPLGLMHIASFLEKNHIAVKIFDSLISAGAEIIEWSDYIYHGVNGNFLEGIIRKEDPDLVGITNPFTAQIKNTIKAAELVKRVNPDIFVAVGGPHFAVLGENFLKENKDVDATVAGEGELTTFKLANALKDKKPLNNISGLIFRSKHSGGHEEITVNKPELIKDIDSLPFPAYHLIEMDRYFYLLKKGLSARPNKYQQSISMITSRGCPFNCVFCSIRLHMGNIWRAHSVDYVISHIQHVVDEYKVKHISFEDDNFTFNPQRCEKILDQLLKRKIGVNWDTPNGVRADTLNRDLLAKMKMSGCQELIVGAESGDQETLDKIINKNLKLESVIQAAKWCKELKIGLRSFFVIGFPGETKTKIRRTIDFAYWLYKKFNVKPNLMIATPLFGTKLYEIAVKNGYLARDINPYNLAIATQSRGSGIIKTSEFAPCDLKDFSRQLEVKIARLDLIRKLFHPQQYPKALKLFFAKPKRLFFYLKRLKQS